MSGPLPRPAFTGKTLQRVTKLFFSPRIVRVVLVDRCGPIERRLLVKYGARNKVQAVVTSIEKSDVVSLVKFEVTVPAQMASVLTTESLEEMDLKVGDEIRLVVKAVNVLPVKE